MNTNFFKSVYLNDTQVISDKDGSFNFRVFDADIRMGHPVQELLPSDYKTHGKTVMYNSQLFPANETARDENDVSFYLKDGSELSNAEASVMPYLNQNNKRTSELDPSVAKLGDDVLKALEIKYISLAHKQALHNEFRKRENSLHPIVHTVTDSNVEVVSIAINIHALSKVKVGKRSSENISNDINFLIYANNEGEPDIENPPLMEITTSMAANHYAKDLDKFKTNKSFKINGVSHDTYSSYNIGELIENDTGGYFVRQMKGKATSDYLFETVIHLPPNPKGKKRVIKVSRIDADDEFPDNLGDTAAASLHSITEMVPCLLSHPNSAIVAATIDSRAFSSVPTRKYLLKLLKMKVPSNYLPDTKECMGNWNGKFKTVGSYATGAVLGGSSRNSVRIREPKQVIGAESGATLPARVDTSTKKHGSGSIVFPTSVGTNEYRERFEKVIKVLDPYAIHSRSAQKGGLNTTHALPCGSFGSTNFTIEFFIKTTENNVRHIYEIDNAVVPIITNGDESVTKVIIASEDNIGAVYDDMGVPGQPAFADLDVGEMAIMLEDLPGGISKEDLGHLTQGRLFGGAWRIEIGTKDSERDGKLDFGKVRFRAIAPEGAVDISTTQTNEGLITTASPSWQDTTTALAEVASVSSTTNVADNAWHHIAVVRNGNDLMIFIDGTKESTQAVTAEIYGFKHLHGNHKHKGEIQIGGTKRPFYASSFENYLGNKVHNLLVTSFTGNLDEVMVSTRAKYTADFDSEPDDLKTLMKNDFHTQLYITADNQENSSLVFNDFAEAVVDDSFRFDPESDLNQPELQWTDNPAWIFYDIVTNERYGFGKYGIKESSIDKWNLYEIAKYCDEKVETGLDSKYKPRQFEIVKYDVTEETITKTENIAGYPILRIKGFANQKEFEKEFPEYSTIAIYNLDDEAQPVHRRIKYLERSPAASLRDVHSNEASEAYEAWLKASSRYWQYELGHYSNPWFSIAQDIVGATKEAFESMEEAKEKFWEIQGMIAGHQRLKYGKDDNGYNRLYGYLPDTIGANDHLTSGDAVIVLLPLLSVEECYRIQPEIDTWIKNKKFSKPQDEYSGAQFEHATEKQLIQWAMDTATTTGGKLPKYIDKIHRRFTAPLPINATSTGGLCATEFYNNFDILEPRFSANLYITSQVDGYKLLNDIASIFRGITYFANGKVFAFHDKKRDPIYNFTNANVKDGIFVYSGSSKSARFTTCVVRYVDKYENYKPRIEYVEDPDGIVKYGIIEKELIAFGCASRSQAKRLGKWFLYTSQYETDLVEFSAGKECAYMRPGDVINIIDKTRTQKRFGGRVTDFVDGEHKIKVDLNLSEDYVGQNIHITIVDDFEFSDSLDKKVDNVFIDEHGKITNKTVTDEEIANVRKSQVKTYKIKSIEPDKSLVPVENRILEIEEVGGDPATDFGKIKMGSIFILNQKDSDITIQENTFKLVNVSQVNDVEYKIQAMQYTESKFDLADNKSNMKIDLKYSRSPIEYSRPAKPIGVPRITINPISKGLERELNVAWQGISPAPDKYKIVITFVSGDKEMNSSNSKPGSKIILQKDAKDSDGEVIDTSVSVNIGSYTGELDVDIYTVDSEGNLDLIYY